MSNFVLQSYLSFRALYAWSHWWSWLSSVWMRPFMFAAIFSVVGRFAVGSDAAQRYLLGMAAAQMVAVSTQATLRSFADDLRNGTLSFVLNSGANRFKLVWARGLPHMANGLLAFAGCILSVRIVLGLDLARVDWLALVVAVLLIGWSTTALAIGASSVALAMRSHEILTQAIIGVLATLTGAVIPLSEFPDAVRALCHLLPMTNGLEGLRQAFNGASVSEIADKLLAEAAVGLVFAAIAFFVFRYVETRGRQRGLLEGIG